MKVFPEERRKQEDFVLVIDHDTQPSLVEIFDLGSYVVLRQFMA